MSLGKYTYTYVASKMDVFVKIEKFMTASFSWNAAACVRLILNNALLMLEWLVRWKSTCSNARAAPCVKSPHRKLFIYQEIMGIDIFKRTFQNKYCPWDANLTSLKPRNVLLNAARFPKWCSNFSPSKTKSSKSSGQFGNVWRSSHWAAHRIHPVQT